MKGGGGELYDEVCVVAATSCPRSPLGGAAWAGAETEPGAGEGGPEGNSMAISRGGWEEGLRLSRQDYGGKLIELELCAASALYICHRLMGAR